METVPAQSDLRALLDRYELHDPGAGKKLLDLRCAMDPVAFFSEIRNEISERPASVAVRYAASLLEFGDLAQMVFKLYRHSREQGIGLARKLQLSDPRFDTALFKMYGDKHAPAWSHETFLMVIDILDAISERDRLVLGVSKFLKDSDPILRAKISLFIARRRPTVTWASDISRESDPRVQASILEGLFEAREDFVEPLFRKYAMHENGGVAGNATLGLYCLGDVTALRLMDEMARHPDPEFRATGASIMGQTGDPRFSPNLAALLSDADERVRKNALRALGEIKKATGIARNHNSLRSVLLKRRTDQGRDQVIATVCRDPAEAVHSIPATRFILKVGGAYPRDYSVQEHSSGTLINAGFIVCDPPKGDDLLGIDLKQAVEERCSEIRKGRDKLAFSRLMHETHLRCYASDARASVSILTKSMPEISFGSPNLNLVVVGATPHTRAAETLIEMAANSSSRVHVIAVSPEWRTAELRRQVQDAGGYFQSAEADQVAQCCSSVYAALLHHYRISWEKTEGAVEIEIRSPEATAFATLQSEAAESES